MLLRERRARAEVLPETVVRAVVLVAQHAHDFRGTRAGSRSRRARRPRGWRVRRRGRAAASASPSRRSRRSTCRRSRDAPRPRACDSGRPPRARPRRTGRCGSCPVPGESRNWLPPSDVQQSTQTTTHGRRSSAGEEVVGELREVAPERRAVAPHVELAGEALDHVDRGVAAIRLVVVARRQVDPERPLVRVAERVSAQRVALEDESPRSGRRARTTRAPCADPS